MQATDILSSEHRLIERVIAAMEVAANELEAGQPVRAGFFLDAARFIREFADGWHHRKEEGVLFQAMADGGMPTHTGPIAVMLHDHERGRELTVGLRDAAQRLADGDQSSIAAIVFNVRAYSELLTQHIHKEDHILFRMADSVIASDRHDELLAEFARVESGRTGTLTKADAVALADALVHEMGGVRLRA